ncbi:MAG: HAD family hydrolase [archaeon]
MIKLLIFDMWGTLAGNPDYRPFLESVGIECHSREEQDMVEAIMSRRFETERDCFKKFCESVGVEETDELYKRFCKAMGMSKNTYPDVIPGLTRLKGKYKLVVLSNTEQLSVESGMFKDIEPLFDKLYYSCDVGLVKPDPKIYAKVLEDFDVKPEEVIMIGDRVDDDVKGPGRLGIKGILLDRRKRYPDYKGKKVYSLKELEVVLDE